MPRRELFRAIVFDLDNTLLDRDRLVRRYLREHYADHVEALIAQDDRGRSDRLDFASKAVERLELQESPQSFWHRFRQELSDCVDINHDVIEFLNRLHKDFKLGLLTYGAEKTQRTKILRMGIEPCFDVIGISGSMPWAKPDARAFHDMCQRLGVREGEALMVGDDLVMDVEGALNAGLEAVWIGDQNQSQVDTLKSVFELEGWLDNHDINSRS